MMKRLRRAMATRSASNSASASGLSTCLVRDTFCCWSSPKPLPAPLPSLSALAQYLADCLREIERSRNGALRRHICGSLSGAVEPTRCRRRFGVDDRRLRLGGSERPRAAWHALHRADGRSRGDRGGVQGAPRHQLPTRSDVARSGGLMTDIIILHHYDTSPYSEKVRLGLGLKGLAWASVEIPVIMPKPDLTALTGGYRKTPVLQIGADLYCDSQLIMRELERRHPSPSFYPAGRGAADALAWWAEKTMFSPAVSMAFAKKPDALPEGFLEDRAKFSGRNIDPAAMMAAVPNLLDQLPAHFDWLDQSLADGRSFLQGPAAGLADLAAYHPVWFLRQNFGSAAAPLDGFPRLLSWAERVAAIGHGRRSPMSAQQALDVARDATSIARATVDPQDPIGRKPGQTVTVTPDDTGRDPVVGELVASDVHEIVIRRSDREIGEVCVHFPRAGFVVAPA